MEQTDKAVMYLEDELQELKRRFENGSVRAFGDKQEKIFAEFQNMRQLQAQIAMKQVAVFGDTLNQFRVKKEKQNTEEIESSLLDQDALDQQISAMDEVSILLSTVCQSINKVQDMTKGV